MEIKAHSLYTTRKGHSAYVFNIKEVKTNGKVSYICQGGIVLSTKCLMKTWTKEGMIQNGVENDFDLLEEDTVDPAVKEKLKIKLNQIMSMTYGR